MILISLTDLPRERLEIKNPDINPLHLCEGLMPGKRIQTFYCLTIR